MNPVSSLRDGSIALANTNLSEAIKLAERIDDQVVRSNTIGKIIEHHISRQKDLSRFFAVLEHVGKMTNPKDQTRALVRVMRNAKRAGDAIKESDLSRLRSAVNTMAGELRISPEELTKKLEDESNKIRKKAMEATDPLEAFYIACQVPNDKEELLRRVVTKFGVSAIQKADRTRFETEAKGLRLRKEAALKLDPLARDKELSKIGYQFASMNMLDEAKATIALIEDAERLQHALGTTRNTGRLVDILAPERMGEFRALLKK